jgi:acetylglutamate kinase
MSKPALYIVKIGGNVVDNPDALQRFLTSFAALSGLKILVHGGGKIATEVASKLGVTTQMIDGRRITDQAMLDVVMMVYGGLVNKKIVGLLQALGCDALGLTGADAGIIKSQKRPVKQIDYGFVGDVTAVNAPQLASFLQDNLTPVVAPLTLNIADGGLLNTNADTMASAVAVALAQDFDVNLTYCFEKKGVLANPDDDDAVIPTLTPESYAAFKAEGVINKGMIPKLDNAFDALQNGVARVTICHADQLGEALETANAGTKIVLSQ